MSSRRALLIPTLFAAGWLTTGASPAQVRADLDWETDFGQALADAKARGRPLFVYVYDSV